MGFLCRAYIQTMEYGDNKEYAQKALDLAKTMMADCETNGAQYGIVMYPSPDAVFSQENNYENREALWKHRFVSGGSSNNAWILNESNKLFGCVASQFNVAVQYRKEEHEGNRYEGKTDYEFWGTQYEGQFMHLCQRRSQRGRFPTGYVINPVKSLRLSPQATSPGFFQ